MPLEGYLDTWQRGGLGPRVLAGEDGHLVVTSRGARAVPFDDRGRPLLWLSPAVLPGAEVGAWAASEAWNFGAERLWIGPELRLMVKDRGDFDGSYELSRAMDPGMWELAVVHGERRLGVPSGGGEFGGEASDEAGGEAGPLARQQALSLRQRMSLPVYPV
ncbi:MAG TPA: hypothetical protein VFD39_01795, partial [Trueperaceae bacterium]|nr:hypothetical protein [Trueperaceae bacterium]